MAAKKRKAVTNPTAEQSKKIRISSTSITGESDNPSEVTASGRPKRNSLGEPNYSSARTKTQSVEQLSKSSAPKIQTAATKVDTTKNPRTHPSENTVVVEIPAKKRGRPRTETTQPSTPTKTASRKSALITKSPKKSTTSTVRNVNPKELPKESAGGPAVTGKRGRSKGAGGKAVEEDAVLITNGDSNGAMVRDEERGDGKGKGDYVDVIEDDRQFWLMKAEPESRMEKGHDVKFSIDDLKDKGEPEGWDGVRNPVARNNMRAMRKGDLAFFYHSNCNVPGIAGVMRIVQEHSVDESAFDPKHPYYDPKSKRETPKWELVHVAFVHKFANLITLKQLKAFTKPGDGLENLQTLKQSRLSVSSVSSKEWNFIMELSGESFDEDRDEKNRVNENE